MELKTKLLKWSAGIPVAMLNEKTARKMGVNTGERIFIKTISRPYKNSSTIVDTIKSLVGEEEIAVSSELKERLGLRIGQKVDVSLASPLNSILFIKKKLNKKRLSKKEIEEIIKDITTNSLFGEEIALFVSAMYKNGMNFEETVYLIKSILKFGKSLKLKDKLVADKHCIGGVPGNRTTPIVVSICSAAGLTMPKNSSRAITTAAGTADVIETIAEIEFSIPQLKKILKKANACLVWGGSLSLLPADSKIIQVEKLLKIDPEAQLLASIMSKKLAVGSNYILIDIPYGKTAKFKKSKAQKLKKKFEKLGRYFHKNLKAVLTDGSQPIGNGVGPALELMDIVNILDPKKQGPLDLEKKSLFLSAELLEMTGKAKKGQGLELAEKILHSGEAFKKFKQIIKAQKGSLKPLESIRLGKYKKEFRFKKSGKILEIDNHKINSLAKIAGCPSEKFAGLYLYHHVGDKVVKKEKILTIYAQSKIRLWQASRFYKKSKPIKLR